jgi:outer membrane immunogenic protein
MVSGRKAEAFVDDASVRRRSRFGRRPRSLSRRRDCRRSFAPARTGRSRRFRARGDLSWTGFYIGGQVGAGGSRSSWSDPVTGGNNIFTGGAAFLGGGVFGADYPSNALVLGVEGDFNWTGINGNGTNSVGDAIGAGTQWTSTFAGRVGAAFDRLLVYGKGRGAFARDRSSFTDRAGNSASNAFARTGWIAGIGLEYGITENWLSKVEYDYLSFGTQLLNFTTATPTAYASSASLSAQQVKAGINLRFSGPR